MKLVHKTTTGNLGDLLCSPKYYFDFKAGKANQVIGGGVQTNLMIGKQTSLVWLEMKNVIL